MKPHFNPAIALLILRGPFFQVLGLAFFACVQAACTCVNQRADEEIRAMMDRAKGDLMPLESAASAELSPDQRRYLDFYRIQAVNEQSLGSFKSGGLTLAGQFLHPSSSSSRKGSVIVVHGYLDHAGTTANLINRLVGDGYHVAVYDQPGHGLSEGRRVSVRDFDTYQAGFSDFLGLVSKNLPAPYDVVAHSMGSTVVIDHLDKKGGAPIRRLIFLTPLIRDTKSTSLHAFGAVISPFADYLVRVPEDNTLDSKYREFVTRDPLQSPCVATRWSVAFNRWRRTFVDSRPRPEAPLIIYAGMDTVVDNKVGQDWLRRVFPSQRQVVIEQGGHQLLNETEPIREQVLNLISQELGTAR